MDETLVDRDNLKLIGENFILYLMVHLNGLHKGTPLDRHRTLGFALFQTIGLIAHLFLAVKICGHFDQVGGLVRLAPFFLF